MIPHFFYPSISLKQYVSKYWYWMNVSSIPILPPGSGCELFIFNKKIGLYDDSKPDEIHYVYSALVRPRYAPIYFLTDESVSFMSIRFRLGSVNYFTKDFESDYETIVNAYDLWGSTLISLRENILNTSHIYSKFEHVEHFLLEILHDVKNTKLDLAKVFLNQIYYETDNMSIAKIVENIGYSQRHLQKTVKLVTGLSLIEAKRLIRFEHAMKQILKSHADPIKNEHYLSSYYDQAHFIKEFTHFTQMSPKKFLLENKESSHFYNRVAAILEENK